MDKPPEKFKFGFEESGEDDEGSKKKSKKAKNIGAFASSTLSGKDSEKEEKPKNLFELLEDKSAKKEKAEAQGKSEKEDTNNEQQAIEDLKHKVIEQETEAEIVALSSALEKSEPGTPEHTEAVALKAFAQRLNEKAKDPTIEVEPEIDAEFERRKAEIQTEDLEELLEFVEEPPEPEFGANESDEEVPEPPTMPVPVIATSIPKPVSATTASRGTTPPVAQPYTPSTLPLHPSSGGSSSSGGIIGGANTPRQPETTPPTNLDILRKTPQPETSTRTNNGEFLIGGVLGYMVGRRGGRKRTERRLQPEINKLSSEVESTKRHLASREEELRKVASEKIRETDSIKRETVAPQRKRTPVNEILRQTITTPEVIINTPEYSKEDSVKKPEVDTTPEVIIKKAEQLSTPELLKLAETMYVDGTSVRKLYETNRIDRVGLLRVVQEGMRGKNVSDTFEKVELGRERQRERAREFRHDDPGFTKAIDNTILPVASPAPLAPLQVPNNPDPTSVKPITNLAAPLNVPEEAKSQPTPTAKPDSKVSYLAPFAVFAIGIALLIAWLLFSI